MLDFLRFGMDRYPRKHIIEVYPKFVIGKKSTDLMIRGGDFYAIWDEEAGLWSTDEDTATKLIDAEIRKHVDDVQKKYGEEYHVSALYLWDSDSGMIDKWHRYVQKQCRDLFVPLDDSLVFANDEIKKENYATKRLPYPLEKGETKAYDELMSVLYSEEERKKIEWAIGAIVSGDSKKIQKFIVLYGSAGTGKSTVINIIQDLFEGYCSSFSSKALGAGRQFALEPFLSNPLVSIEHDGDLSRIEDNTRLNSIVSHEALVVDAKYKSAYEAQFKSFLIMATNRPVKITDAKSGILRRLIDVSPTGNKVPVKKYQKLTSQIRFELGAIAYHCLEVYKSDPYAYNNYIPTQMLGASNDFYNFILESFEIFAEADGVTLKAAWEMYNTYCDEAKVGYPYSKRVFKEELKNYFRDFKERERIGDDRVQVRNWYSGFRKDKFEYVPVENESKDESLFKQQPSILDELLADCPAQYATDAGTPEKKWSEVTTKLKDLDTSKLHYVLMPKNYIFIDFDLKDENGEKSFEKNLEATSKWPTTYSELSKSGKGIHLHYIYDGDVSKLSNTFDKDIEIKVSKGKAALRRQLSKCTDAPIATINSGLPTKGEKKMVDMKAVQSEKGLRTLIERNLKKEIHPGTKPSVDFIFKILEDAYNGGLKYDVTNMRPKILAFAAKSTHQSEYCIKMVNNMHFKSEEPSDASSDYDASSLVFYDVEVFPNLFIVVYKAEGNDPVKLINPTPEEIENLLRFKLVGFNCRRYDNHIMYARLMGYDNAQLYRLSQRIVNGSKNAFFGEAYNLSYTDVYDFSSKKQSLKKFEIELGIHHQELGLPWDQPVPEEKWELVADYCINDVVATEATFYARKQDFVAREILAKLSGLTVNDTTRMHTTKIIFGNEKHPALVYTDLSEMFPGYTYDNGHSSYRGEDPGEGGYVYAEPGMYFDIALLDIASMHPTSIINLNLFGSYTDRFKAILDARLAIKHHDLDTARGLLNGALAEFLTSDEQADQLAQALKIVINSVYGYTTATFDNPFKDPRNIDNIVAKRGALFMIDLKHEVQARGFTVAHIKTDSIKIPNATKEIIDFVIEFGKKYGYNFEHEATYDRMCLVNDAVYIAKYADGGKWTATGTQFQVPYVFKSLFSHEPIEFDDLCETKMVSTALYLDMNEGLPDVSGYEKSLKKTDEDIKAGKIEMSESSYKEYREELEFEIAAGHNYIFIGKAGRFCPVKPGAGGGLLMREKDGKYYAATGSKGYRWMESEMVDKLKKQDDIDITYYAKLVDDAVDTIEKYGSYEVFISDEPCPPFDGGTIINLPNN